MKPLLKVFVLLFSSAAIWACVGVSSVAMSSDAITSDILPCDIDAIFAERCRTCHADPPLSGAPMPLLTLKDLYADAVLTPGKKVYEAVGIRIHDDARPMPQRPNPRLTLSETATLDAWIAAGAPAGSVACRDAGADAAVLPLNCTPDQRIRPAAKHAVPSGPDVYVCYGFDTTTAEKRHVIAAAPRIDNTRVVHHVLLFHAPNSVSPIPEPCGPAGGSNWRLVTGWAPGGKNLELPAEAGFPEETGTTHWALQIHYNNALGLPEQVDETGYDLCTTRDLRPYDADILATGTLNVNIPPRSTHTTQCDVEIPPNYGRIKVVSSWAHMHRLGRAEYARRVRNGEEATLLDVPNFDFSVGGGASSISVDLAAGDTVRTTCKWQNTGDRPVYFGEGTDDEMCFAFMTYFPKITGPFHWLNPSLGARCTSSTE